MSIKEDLLSIGQSGEDDYVELLDSVQQLTDSKRELDQLVTVSDSLESLLRHVSSVKALTPEHADLIKVSCENLLIGTHYDHTVLIPSLESSMGGTVSTEALTDKLSAVWKRIVSAVLSILAALKRFWVKVSSFKGRLEISATDLKKSAAIARNRPIKNPVVDVGFNARNLMLGNSVVNDVEIMIRSVVLMCEQYKIVTNHYPKGMLTVGATYEGLLKRGTDDVRELLEEICTAGTQLPFTVVATALHAMSYKDARFGSRQIMIAPPQLGGFSLFVAIPDEPVRGLVGNELLTMASNQRTAGLKFAQTDINVQAPHNTTIKTASGQQVEALAVKVLALLKTLDDQESARQIRRIDAQIKSVMSAAESFKSHPIIGEGNMVYSESILRFVRTYASWANGPIDSMSIHMLTVARALLIYGKKSLG